MSYYAMISDLVNVRKHPNADKLNLANCSGYQVIVGLDAKDGDKVILFPDDGQLSTEYCQANDLISYIDEEGNKKGGYFDKNRRVRAQVFRGLKSEAFVIFLESLLFTGIDINSLKIGDKFTEINGIPICNKYLTDKTRNSISGQNKHKSKKMCHLKQYFKEHFDTEQFKHAREDELYGLVTLTGKCHGTCLLKDTQILMFDGSKKKIQDVQVGDEVVGFTGDITKAIVTDTFIHGTTKEWLNIKINRSFARTNGGNSFSSIKLTPEHMIYTSHGYKEAKDLKAGETVFIIREDIVPSDDQFQIILGKLIGDASLTKSSKYSCGIEFRHKKAHEDYIDYTFDALGNLAGPRTKQNYISGYGSEIISVVTKFSSFNKKYFTGFKTNGEDRLPEWISEKMGPIALAFWYMDDGSLCHTEVQRDRAAFATCRYSYNDCLILKKGLKNNGITNVSILLQDKYWRMKINAGGGSADRFFKLISPYVPKSMRYKLPEEYKNSHFNIEWQDGIKYFDYAPTKVLSIEKLPPVGICRKKYDITTTTSNFIANDIVVHNSARSAYLNVPVLQNNGWIKRQLNKINANWFPKEKFEWKSLYATRRVIKGEAKPDANDYRVVCHRRLQPFIEKGMTVFYEIVGYEDSGKPIMPSVSTDKLPKDLKKRFGKTITYKYGCLEGTCKILVYRITIQVEDKIYELPWNSVKKWCNNAGIEHVAEKDVMLINFAEDVDRLKNTVEFWTEEVDIAEPMDNSHIREGICIRVDKFNGGISIFKNKTWVFRLAEGIIKDSGIEDAEEVESYVEVE